MKYKGFELKEITKPQIFDPPKEILVWNDSNDPYEEPRVDTVYAVIAKEPGVTKAIGYCCRWEHCAEIPKELKPRRVTNRELAKWLAFGNGEYKNRINLISTAYTYDESESDVLVDNYFKVRKWDDIEWHEPTIDYMGIEFLNGKK